MVVNFPGKKRYKGVRFNVISVTMGWVGVKFPGKKRYVTLEWPLVVHPALPDDDHNFDDVDAEVADKSNSGLQYEYCGILSCGILSCGILSGYPAVYVLSSKLGSLVVGVADVLVLDWSRFFRASLQSSLCPTMLAPV